MSKLVYRIFCALLILATSTLSLQQASANQGLEGKPFRKYVIRNHVTQNLHIEDFGEDVRITYNHVDARATQVKVVKRTVFIEALEAVAGNHLRTAINSVRANGMIGLYGSAGLFVILPAAIFLPSVASVVSLCLGAEAARTCTRNTTAVEIGLRQMDDPRYDYVDIELGSKPFYSSQILSIALIENLVKKLGFE